MLSGLAFSRRKSDSPGTGAEKVRWNEHVGRTQLRLPTVFYPASDSDTPSSSNRELEICT